MIGCTTTQSKHLPSVQVEYIALTQEGNVVKEIGLCGFFLNQLYFLEQFYLGFCLCIRLHNFGRKVVERTQAGAHDTDSVHH